MLGIIIALYLKAEVNALHLMTPLYHRNYLIMSYLMLMTKNIYKNLRMPWVKSEEILKTVEKIIIGDMKCPENVQRGDIYDLVMGKNITGSIRR